MAVEKYKLLLDLWKSENPVKTTKLQVLILVNSILVSVFLLTSSFWIALAGMLFALVWILSIGRTVSYQRHWKNEMDKLQKGHSDNIVFRIHDAPAAHRLWGRVPSAYYTIGAAVAAALIWFVVLLITLLLQIGLVA